MSTLSKLPELFGSMVFNEDTMARLSARPMVSASGSSGMWTELFLDNVDYLTEEVDILVKNLTAFLEALQARDADRLCALLREGREKKAAAGGN